MPLALYLPPEMPAIIQPASHVSRVPAPATSIPFRPGSGGPQFGSGTRPGKAAPNAADATKHPIKPQNTCQGPVDAPTGFCGIHGGGGLS